MTSRSIARVGQFWLAAACFAALALPLVGKPIDREALVRRHDVRVGRVDPYSPVSVGNGDFAFTADATGLQSFGDYYYNEGIPLETLTTLPWAWHEFPNVDGLRFEQATKPYNFHGRTIHYAGLQHSPAGAYYRENPHPVPLGQISFVYQGRPLELAEIDKVGQILNQWTGTIHSRYTLDGQPVEVETVAHSELSQVAVQVRSPLLKEGKLQVRFRFAYSYEISARNRPRILWDKDDRHRTTVVAQGDRSRQLERALDGTRYYVNVGWEGAADWTNVGPHDFRLASHGADSLRFTCGFSGSAEDSQWPEFAATRRASTQGWKDYWTKGGVVDLSLSKDPRAAELERRIVISQYLMKVNYAGHFPPAETGLTHISWFGKHNSEMYFWHAAQFYQWGHTDLLEKGLAWYRQILPVGMADAASKGFDGVRWPKMAGIDGRPGPGEINPFIIWNQPNPIYLSELVYRAHPNRDTLEKYRDLVFESAKFLASFAFYDQATDRYVLGPPIKNVSESTGENLTQNPTFELAYWYYGLKVAQAWRERLGLTPDPKWADILAKLSKLPVRDGKYLEVETFPDIYDKPTGGLPTSMLMALGFLPLTEAVDPEIIRNTFHELNRRSPQGLGRWVSWSMGQAALTAARLGEPEAAVTILSNNSVQARLLNNGHVLRAPHDCVAFLPLNASLLAAVGLMAGGWDGAPAVNAPGFPQDGKWTVRSEGLNSMP